jgi:hypothetical protein
MTDRAKVFLFYIGIWDPYPPCVSDAFSNIMQKERESHCLFREVPQGEKTSTFSQRLLEEEVEEAQDGN